MPTVWYHHLLWVLGAGALGFALSALLAGRWRLRRNLFLIPYVLLGGAFVAAYVRWAGLDVSSLLARNALWGVLGAIVLGAFMVRNVRSQPPSARSAGARLAFDLLWQGLVYGAVDTLLLTFLPVAAAWEAGARLGWTISWPGRLASGALGLAAGLLVTWAYHRGYPEYRGRRIAAPLIGNALMTLGYLLTASPLAALGSHIAMHVAGVMHGPETTVQLPPHKQ